MKYIIYIVVLFTLSLTSSGQGSLDSLEKPFSALVCKCITQTKSLTEEKFLSCFQETLAADKAFSEKILQSANGDTSEEEGYRIGKALFERVSVKLIYSCDAFFHLMDTLRYSTFREFNATIEQRKIDSLNRIDRAKWKAETYTENGLSYFRIKDYKNALANFESALRLDSTEFQSAYFKAWCLENLGDFASAYDLYLYVADQTKRTEILVFAAIAKRKKDGL